MMTMMKREDNDNDEEDADDRMMKRWKNVVVLFCSDPQLPGLYNAWWPQF